MYLTSLFSLKIYIAPMMLLIRHHLDSTSPSAVHLECNFRMASFLALALTMGNASTCKTRACFFTRIIAASLPKVLGS